MLTNKVALVTGGSGGIGRAIVERLFRAGAAVAIHCGKRVEAAQALAAQLDDSGQRTFVTQANVASWPEVTAMTQQVIQRFGRLDILVNCAGAGVSRDSALALTQEDWDMAVDLNFKGAGYCCQEAIGWMKEHGGGHIVNISTSAIYAPRGGTIPYSASKAAVINMTRALALEFGPDNIWVNAVAPGPTETEMVKQFFTPERLAKTVGEIPLRRIAQPEDIAGAVLFLLSDDAKMLTGQTLVVDGGRSLRHLES